MTRGYPTACAAAGLVALLLVGIDPNGHFASENDIYMLRQIQALRELAPWRWELSDPAVAFAQAKFWLANLSLYFHGPLPPLLQAVFLDIAQAVTGHTGNQTFLLSVGLIHVAGTVLFALILRHAGIGPLLAFVGALALALSPMWLGISRGFGASWLAGVVFGQCLLVWSIVRTLAGARSGAFVVALALTNILLSDVLSPFQIGAACIGILACGRAGREAMLPVLRSVWMLLPAACVLWIGVTNLFVFWRGVADAQQVVLFLYPFAQYLVGLDGHGGAVGAPRWDWLDRVRILFLLFGPGLVPAAAFAIAGLVRGTSTGPAGRTDLFVPVWALVSAAGFGMIFLGFAGPGTGSQAMPTVGYPVYLAAPGTALLALGFARAARRFALPATAFAAALWLAGTAFGSFVYVWRIDLPGPGALLTVRESTDSIGFRYPDTGLMGAGHVVRAAIEHAPADADIAVAVVTERANSAMRNILFWRAGVIDGGAFERSGRRCLARAAIDRSSIDIERPTDARVRVFADRLATDCAGGFCIGVGDPDAALGWTIRVRGEITNTVDVLGYGIARPDGIADVADSAALERVAAGEISLLASPIGYMGMRQAGRARQSQCAP